MAYETDRWPIIKSRWFTRIPAGTRRDVRVIVLHTMEAPEREQTAENVARWFQTLPEAHKASAHICVDSNSVVQSVMDNDVAYAAPGCNHDGIQIEMAGYARQTLSEWMDPFGWQLLNRTADATAQYCLKYSLPIVHLMDEYLKKGHRGIVGHDQVTRVYKKSSHTDPGPKFPWEYFLQAVKTFYEVRR